MWTGKFEGGFLGMTGLLARKGPQTAKQRADWRHRWGPRDPPGEQDSGRARHSLSASDNPALPAFQNTVSPCQPESTYALPVATAPEEAHLHSWAGPERPKEVAVTAELRVFLAPWKPESLSQLCDILSV